MSGAKAGVFLKKSVLLARALLRGLDRFLQNNASGKLGLKLKNYALEETGRKLSYPIRLAFNNAKNA